MADLIGIQFCGGCNSRIDRVKIAEALKLKLEGQGYQVEYNPGGAGFWIYLSGCSASCAVKSRKDEKGIVVAGEALERVEVLQEELISKILVRVGDHFERLAK